MNTISKPKVFYRVETYYYTSSGQDKLELSYQEWFAIKETPKGYWISKHHYNSFLCFPANKEAYPDMKFILKLARRKFAYETKELAMNSFVIRREKYIQRLKATLRRSEKFLEMGKSGVLEDTSPNGICSICFYPDDY